MHFFFYVVRNKLQTINIYTRVDKKKIKRAIWKSRHRHPGTTICIGTGANFFSMSSPGPDLADEDLISVLLFYNSEPRRDSTVVGLSFKRYSVSIGPRPETADEDLKQIRIFLENGKYRPKT